MHVVGVAALGVMILIGIFPINKLWFLPSQTSADTNKTL
jgi:hypothetical protein